MGSLKTEPAASSTDLTRLVEKGLTEVMMVTVELGGQRPHVRPMQVAQLDDDGSVWFFAPPEGVRACGPLRGSATSVSGTRWLQLTGRCEIVTDRDWVTRLADEMEGSGRHSVAETGPATLLHFIPEAADYWDTASVRGLGRPMEHTGSLPTVVGVSEPDSRRSRDRTAA